VIKILAFTSKVTFGDFLEEISSYYCCYQRILKATMSTGIINISNVICIEASSKVAALRYATMHDIDHRRCEWRSNSSGHGGRLYVAEKIASLDSQWPEYPQTGNLSAALCSIV
jgi:hypothetical protein